MNHMNEIWIYKTCNCDTRTNTPPFSEATVESDTIKHIKAVEDACGALATMLIRQSQLHDCTKLGVFLPDFTWALSTGLQKEGFKSLDWWQIHINQERHHLNDRCPDDVNLVDVIEMICDCVCAGKARNVDGKIFPINLSNDILQKAVTNTSALLQSHIHIKG